MHINKLQLRQPEQRRRDAPAQPVVEQPQGLQPPEPPQALGDPTRQTILRQGQLLEQLTVSYLRRNRAGDGVVVEVEPPEVGQPANVRRQAAGDAGAGEVDADDIAGGAAADACPAAGSAVGGVPSGEEAGRQGERLG